MCVAKELWGLDPDSGKLRWYATATDAEQAYASVITDADQVFAFTGRGGGSVAVKAGGTGDVSNSNRLWTGDEIAGGPMADRMKELDTDSDGAITEDEFRSGMAKMFGGGRPGGGRSGGGRPGGGERGGYGRGEDTRLDRPQRPVMED